MLRDVVVVVVGRYVTATGLASADTGIWATQLCVEAQLQSGQTLTHLHWFWHNFRHGRLAKQWQSALLGDGGGPNWSEQHGGRGIQHRVLCARGHTACRRGKACMLQRHGFFWKTSKILHAGSGWDLQV